MNYTYVNVPKDVKRDIDYIYRVVTKKEGKRSENYVSKKLSEPVLATTIRYDTEGNPVSTSRVLDRDVYLDSVRVLDRYALIEPQNGLYPFNYDGQFKPETSEMLDQQTNFCSNLSYGCIFFSINLKATRVLKRIINGHNNYSKHQWDIDGPYYVTRDLSQNGLQMIGYTGERFRRIDEK